MPYSGEPYLSLFEIETPEEILENIRKKDVWRYRVKTIRAGDYLECEIFPIWNTRAEVRRAKKHKSRKAQERLNIENRKKKIARYANENFTQKDCWGTFTYDSRHLPATPEEADRIWQNFIRRLKRKAKKEGIRDFKYLYTTEEKREPEKKGGGIRPHHHIIFTGGLDRDEVEALWKCGARREVRRLQPDGFGLTGLARYIAKATTGRFRWGHSQDLAMPRESVADRKIKPRTAERIARNEGVAPEFFEKAYRGYAYQDIKIKRSKYVSGVYLYVRMRRKPQTRTNKRKE